MKKSQWIAIIGFWVVLWICGCGEDAKKASENTDSDTGPNSSDPDSASDVDNDTVSDTNTDTHTDADTDTGTYTGTDSDITPPLPVCQSPISLSDITNPTVVIGTGTPASCTETALRTAATQGGIITFNCGPDPVTIDITETIELPPHETTIIDGENLITLDAGKRTRHFHFNEPDWMNNPDGVVLQRLTFINGKAPATDYREQDSDNPQCAYGYADGSGGVLYARNGIIHIIDCTFIDNEAALIGPDVGGGAIYVVGVPELIISGSTFIRNRASNGGAVGMLFCGNPGIYNSRFEDNAAVGTGQNGCCDSACVGVGHEEQTGAGGNSGAVYLDGLNDEDKIFNICGTTFVNNTANELGGALFRTPNSGAREMNIDSCVFDGNTATLGGVSFIKDHTVTVRNTTIMNNSADIIGGLWVNNGTMDVVNCTLFNNHPTGLIVNNGGTVKNTTIVDSPLDGSFTVTNSLFVDMQCNDSQSGSNNVQWPQDTACAAGTTFTNPELGEIGDNGGATPTFMPKNTVSGIGADCPATDQRGESRNTATCAAGAVEP
jgi:hypothetical protein